MQNHSKILKKEKYSEVRRKKESHEKERKSHQKRN